MKANAPPCLCGHSKHKHITGTGLCLVLSCRMCLIYRPAPETGRAS